jgi:hypothetical protein
LGAVSERFIDPNLLDIGVRLLKLPDEELFAILGTQVESSPSMALAQGKEARIITSEAAAKGRAWLDRYNKKLQHEICEVWDYCQKRNKYKETREIVTALAPVVGSALGLSGAVSGVIITIVAILVKSGLDKYCRCK